MIKKTSALLFVIFIIVLMSLSVFGDGDEQTIEYDINTTEGAIEYEDDIQTNKEIEELDDCATITNTKIEVDSITCPELNQPAKITFKNVQIENPVVLYDGWVSSELSKKLEITGDEISLEVEHFSEYEIIESTYYGDMYRKFFAGLGFGLVTSEGGQVILPFFNNITSASDTITDLRFPTQNTGALVGAVQSLGGYNSSRYSLNFDGVDDYGFLDTNSNTWSLGNNNFTIILGSKIDTLSGDPKTILSMNGTDNNKGFKFEAANKDGLWKSWVTFFDGNGNTNWSQKFYHPANTDYTITVLRYDSNGTLEIFETDTWGNAFSVDRTYNPTINITGSVEELILGAEIDSTGSINHLDGFIDYLHIKKEYLTDADLQWILDNPEKPLVMFPNSNYEDIVRNASDVKPNSTRAYWESVAFEGMDITGVYSSIQPMQNYNWLNLTIRADDCGNISSAEYHNRPYTITNSTGWLNFTFTDAVIGKCFQAKIYENNNGTSSHAIANITYRGTSLTLANITETSMTPSNPEATTQINVSAEIIMGDTDPVNLSFNIWVNGVHDQSLKIANITETNNYSVLYDTTGLNYGDVVELFSTTVISDDGYFSADYSKPFSTITFNSTLSGTIDNSYINIPVFSNTTATGYSVFYNYNVSYTGYVWYKWFVNDVLVYDYNSTSGLSNNTNTSSTLSNSFFNKGDLINFSATACYDFTSASCNNYEESNIVEINNSDFTILGTTPASNFTALTPKKYSLNVILVDVDGDTNISWKINSIVVANSSSPGTPFIFDSSKYFGLNTIEATITDGVNTAYRTWYITVEERDQTLPFIFAVLGLMVVLLGMSFSLPKEHYILKLLLIILAVASIPIIPSVFIVGTAETSTSFLRIGLWTVRIFGIYLLLYLIYDWLQRFNDLPKWLEKKIK